MPGRGYREGQSVGKGVGGRLEEMCLVHFACYLHCVSCHPFIRFQVAGWLGFYAFVFSWYPSFSLTLSVLEYGPAYPQTTHI